MIVAAWQPNSALLRRFTELSDAILLSLGAAFAAAALYLLGFWALLYAGYVAGALFSAFYPRKAALAILFAFIVFERQEIDFTWPIALGVYDFTPEVKDLLLFTIQPLEVALVIVAASLTLRRSSAPMPPLRLPLIVWAAPIILAAGFLYGYWKGGAPNLAYIEARGLVYGAIAFYIALRMRDEPMERVARVVLIAVGALAAIVVIRELIYVRSGLVDINADAKFAHEDVAFLGVGLLAVGAMLMRPRPVPSWLLLAGYELFLLAAILLTGRRVGTLVVAVAALSILWLLLPKRPVLVIVVGLIGVLVAGAYLGAYWNQPYGTIGQPARALRSQFGEPPNTVDLSSDTYRERESYNVKQTIRLNPVTGVGFGRPFIAYQALPVLPWWPLQFYTPHNDFLWLWLKMGVGGVVVFLGLWVVALRRVIDVLWSAPRDSPLAMVALTVAGSLVIFLAFAEFDLVFPGVRPMVPLAVTLAAAYVMRPATEPADG